MNLKYSLLALFFLFYHSIFSQKNVSITIDDVPNTSMFKKDGYKSILLEKLDSLKIPIAIFINESLIYKTDSVAKNFELLNNCHRKIL